MRTIEYRGDEKKIEKAIMNEYPEIGYYSLRKLFRKGDVKINGKRAEADDTVRNGDVITLYVQERAFTPKAVYEDEKIAVFYKPKKTVCQGEKSFESRIKASLGDEYILCHRLDTNTDGLVLFAKSEETFEEIKRLFREKRVEKHYLALVYGAPKDEDTLRDFVRKDERKGLVTVVGERERGAKEMITRYAVIARRGDRTLLDVQPETGRTHQIRAHLAHYGFPIVGDGKYGDGARNKKEKEKTQRLTAYKLIFHIQDGPLRYLDGKVVAIDARM